MTESEYWEEWEMAEQWERQAERPQVNSLTNYDCAFAARKIRDSLAERLKTTDTSGWEFEPDPYALFGKARVKA